jgi:hypothetical protein
LVNVDEVAGAPENQQFLFFAREGHNLRGISRLLAHGGKNGAGMTRWQVLRTAVFLQTAVNLGTKEITAHKRYPHCPFSMGVAL